jgi:hypothetical protein
MAAAMKKRTRSFDDQPQLAIAASGSGQSQGRL